MTSATQPTASSESRSTSSLAAEPLAETLEHNREQSKAGNWAGMMASLSLGKEMREQLKSRQAESRWARRELWGADGDSPEDDVEKYVMGDNHEQAIHKAQGGRGPVARAGRAAALNGTGVGAGSAGPLVLSAILDRPAAPPERPDPTVIVEPGSDRDWRLGTPIIE